MRLSAAGVDLIKRYEGFRDHVYSDGVGVATIGYGTTSADVSPLPSRITEPQAAKLLMHRLDAKYEPPVRAIFVGGLPFNQHRYDALVSLVYNLGPDAVPHRNGDSWSSTPGFETLGHAIVAAIKHPRSTSALRAIADAFPRYSNPRDPAVHAELLRRRNDERALFLKPMGRFESFRDDERAWITEYDRLKSHTSPAARSRRDELQTFMRQRMAALKKKARASGWDTDRLHVRYQALERRT
jgi:GH24 family phage-related lysozyme (muramidase)